MILVPFPTRNGSNSSFLIVLFHTTPHLHLLPSELKWSSVSISDLTGPSIWSVKNHSHLNSPQILKKICFQIFLGPFLTFLSVLFGGGRLSSFLTLVMSPTPENLILLDALGRLQLRYMRALADNWFLVASCLIVLNCLVVNLHLLFSTCPATLLTICNKTFDIFWG